jgi:hypothetical protein
LQCIFRIYARLIALGPEKRMNEEREARLSSAVRAGNRPRAAGVAVSHCPADTMQDFQSSSGGNVSLDELTLLVFKMCRTKVVLTYPDEAAELLGRRAHTPITSLASQRA